MKRFYALLLTVLISCSCAFCTDISFDYGISNNVNLEVNKDGFRFIYLGYTIDFNKLFLSAAILLPTSDCHLSSIQPVYLTYEGVQFSIGKNFVIDHSDDISIFLMFGLNYQGSYSKYGAGNKIEYQHSIGGLFYPSILLKLSKYFGLKFGNQFNLYFYNLYSDGLNLSTSNLSSSYLNKIGATPIISFVIKC